ncbi:Xaa-Pro aminopeptidase [Ningiella sp. W23]|uniref:Xaa-Pro aminopeptidase n=1 Tax=Ningiella sp. W23 TaxID=3023715 RepID=UPI003757019A
MSLQTSDFIQRREALLAQCEPSSIVIIPAAQGVTRSNDTEYSFRQDSDFWYLSGFNEPDAMLVLSNVTIANKGKSQHKNSKPMGSIMFMQASDPHAEIWHGRRLGLDHAPASLGVDEAFDIESADELLPELLNQHKHVYFCLDKYPYADAILQGAIRQCKSAPKQSLVAPTHIIDVAPMLHAMRRIKSAAELKIMQQAASISANAHKRAMQIAKPGMYEYQLEAEIHHEFAMNGARNPAYSTIVGSGDNACILHYTENSDMINDGDLVLIDAGCELQGYAADITRTFPANGAFSQAQRELYNLVLNSQMAALKHLKAGACISDGMTACVETMVEGLIALNILQGTKAQALEQESWRAYFMHGLGHYLGLDVHDVGIYKQYDQDVPLEVGVVMTVEPGLYIDAQANVPKQYQGIGIRIEDDIVITSNGHKVLTAGVPKTIDEIEALMRENRDCNNKLRSAHAVS